MIEIKCLECSNKIITFPVFRDTKKFCSLLCRNKNYAKRRGAETGFFGKHHSESLRVWLANHNKLIGNQPPPRNGKIPWNKGKEIFYNRGDKNCMHNPITKMKARIAQAGSKAKNWKGGSSPINKRLRASFMFKNWREKVFKRDGFTCQKCSLKGGLLHPHHIYNFAKYPLLRFEISNGITLCAKCHQEIHANLKLSLK